MQAVGYARTPVRGTQSFVHTLFSCWQRPSLTALEVLWRWGCGIPALLLLWHEAMRVLAGTPIDSAALGQMSLLDPVAASATLAHAAGLLLPGALLFLRWPGALIGLIWVVGSGFGRSAVWRRADPRLLSRPWSLMALHVLRLVALGWVLAVWVAVLWADSRWTVSEPVAAGEEPNVVLFCAAAIVATLGLFTFWAVASWAFVAAPLVALRRGLGGVASLRAAFGLRALRPKLIEINLVMGIVKIALLVLALVFSACPLPFESVATPEFMAWWYVGVAVLYLIGSDFFHVVQLSSYLVLWDAVPEGREFR